jgi:hypothetical protein
MKLMNAVILLFFCSGCAVTQYGAIATKKADNLQVISSGTLKNGHAELFSFYVIDKTIRECFTMLTIYSAVKIDCAKLKTIPEAQRILQEIGI